MSYLKKRMHVFIRKDKITRSLVNSHSMYIVSRAHCTFKAFSFLIYVKAYDYMQVTWLGFLFFLIFIFIATFRPQIVASAYVKSRYILRPDPFHIASFFLLYQLLFLLISSFFQSCYPTFPLRIRSLLIMACIIFLRPLFLASFISSSSSLSLLCPSPVLPTSPYHHLNIYYSPHPVHI